MTDHIVDANKMVPPPHLLKKFSEQARVDSKKRGHSGYCKTFAKLCIDWALNSRAALAEDPVEPTDEEIMELMPQQMRDDLAAAARALAGFDCANIKAAGVMRIILNRHAVDHARAVLARWGNYPVKPDSSPATQPEPVAPVWADIHYAWELLDADGEWQAGGSANRLEDVQREGNRYLQTYAQDGPHKLIIQRHCVNTIENDVIQIPET
jgi:hypothetical protein